MPPKRRGIPKKRVGPVGENPGRAITPAPTHSATAILPAEIWRMVGEYIRGLNALRHLRLVCRDFNAVFTPFCFETRTFNLHRVKPKTTEHLPLPPKVGYTKELRALMLFFFDGLRRRYLAYDPEMRDGYGQYLARLIESTPNLTSFCCYFDVSTQDTRTEIVNNKEVIRALHNAPQLENIQIIFGGSQIGSPEPVFQEKFLNLTGFRNLSAIELYSFYGEENELIHQLSNLLSNTPNLKLLGLGIECDVDTKKSPRAIVVKPEFDGFFENLSIAYEKLGCDPLKLHTLKLGYGLSPIKSSHSTTEPVSYVKKLLCTKSLRNLYVFNGLTYAGGVGAQYGTVDWELFNDCESLNLVSLTRLDRKARDWLNDVGVNVKEILFSDPSAMNGTSQRFLPTLRHSLSTLFAVEVCYHQDLDSRVRHDIEFSEGYSYLSEEDLRLMRVEQEVFLCNNCKGAHKRSEFEMCPLQYGDDFGGPELRRPNIPPTPLIASIIELEKRSDRSRTVLDRLMDGGRNLRQLAISMDLTHQWDHFLVCLGNLKKLTHLRLERRINNHLRWPRPAHSHWYKARDVKEVTIMYCHALKEVCPSLMFVRIGDYTWQFIPQTDLSRIKPENPKTQYELLRLEYNDIYEQPIFSFEIRDMQTGVLQKHMYEDSVMTEGYADDQEMMYSMELTEFYERQESLAQPDPDDDYYVYDDYDSFY